MRAAAVQAIAWALWLSGIPWLLRQALQRRRVTIVLWHDPAPDVFARHLAALRRRYTLVSLGLAVEAIAAGDLRGLPPRPLVLTFDDGHLGNVELQESFATIPGLTTLFVCAVIGSTRALWFLHEPDPQALRRLPDSERRTLVDEERGVGPDTVSAAQLSTLAEVCDVQAHTVTHPYLPACDEATAERELLDGRRWLEAHLGHPVTAISYPNGDYCARDIDLARRTGYSCGITVDAGVNGPHADLFRLRRTCMGDDDSTPLLIVKASGLWDFAKVVLRRRRPTGFSRSPWFDESSAPVPAESQSV